MMARPSLYSIALVKVPSLHWMSVYYVTAETASKIRRILGDHDTPRSASRWAAGPPIKHNHTHTHTHNKAIFTASTKDGAALLRLQQIRGIVPAELHLSGREQRLKGFAHRLVCEDEKNVRHGSVVP